MTKYEKAISKINDINIDVIETTLEANDGLYCDNTIFINKNIDTDVKKYCILAEELGHHFTTFGDISDQEKLENRKQELIARRWGYEHLIKISNLINVCNLGLKYRFETSEFLEVTEDFLAGAIQHYKNKYGAKLETENYIITFEPTIDIIPKTKLKESV